jgi:hypothetical protein
MDARQAAQFQRRGKGFPNYRRSAARFAIWANADNLPPAPMAHIARSGHVARIDR